MKVTFFIKKYIKPVTPQCSFQYTFYVLEKKTWLGVKVYSDNFLEAGWANSHPKEFKTKKAAQLFVLWYYKRREPREADDNKIK